MYIDIHSHMRPQQGGRGPKPPGIFDLDKLLAQQEEAGVVSVFSYTMFTYDFNKVDPTTVDNIKRYHDFAVDLSAKHTGRLTGMAAANPFGGEEHLRETERALKEAGLKGVMINSSVQGEYLDSPRALPFFELMCGLDVPVFVHPPAMTPGVEKMMEYRLVEMIGRPMDTTLSLARAIYAGLLDRFPKLKIVASHLGGAITLLAGRLDAGYWTRSENAMFPLAPWGEDVLSKDPSEYVKQLYVDTVSWHWPAIMCAIETVGVDHVLFGSDFPPVGVPLRDSIKAVEDLPLSNDAKEQILRGNAQRLLDLNIG